MKYVLLLLCCLPFYGMAQNAALDFINKKIETDALFTLHFYPKTNWLEKEDICEVIEFYQQATYRQFRDTSLINELQDTTLSNDDFLALLDQLEATKEPDQLPLQLLDALCQTNAPDLLEQIEQNNQQERHEVKKIPSLRRLVRKPNGRSKSYFSLSNPIFFGQGKFAVITVSMVWGPLYGRGYIELYQKDEEGKWVLLKRMSTWMS